MLQEAALFLAAAVLFVPLFKRARLGSVLGYLAAGLVIGPHGLGYARDAEQVLHASEFGVVLLLFVIGLGLQPRRLWTLRREVFGLGGAQVLLTALPLALFAHYFGVAWAGAAVIGLALAMSSTALVLQLLGERGELTAHHGRGAFAVLLFQDITVIPLLALIPLLSAPASAGIGWQEIAKALAVVAAVIASGRTLLRPALRLLANAQAPEIFTAASLLLVIGVSLAMQAVGLSASLGAFLAGVLLADSEYRHELQADLEPFKGLLLGLFFIAVGMGADLGLLARAPLTVLGLTLGLLLLKALVLYALGRRAGMNHQGALRFGGALAQGGEFAFVLFAVAAAAGLLSAPLSALLTVVVTLSMIATPPLYALFALAARRHQAAPAPYDEIRVAETPVVIAGFGPFGQIIGRVLRVKKIPYTVLDKNAEHVQFVRSFGNPVFFSDAARPEVLRAAHVHQARLFIIAIADEAESLRVAQAVRAFAPKLRVMASARTRQHALQLIDAGINPEDVIRRAYYSSLEMTRRVLLALDLPPREVHRAVDLFHQQDQETLMRQHAVYQDEAALRAAASQFARELEQLFEADKEAERETERAAAKSVAAKARQETP